MQQGKASPMQQGKAMAGYAERGGGRRGRRWRTAAWGTAALLLLLPLLAMQVTDEVDWSVTDFAVFGAMLIAAGGTYDLAARMTGNTAYRAAIGVAIAAAFILVWMNLAVGIIGDRGEPRQLDVWRRARRRTAGAWPRAAPEASVTVAARTILRQECH
jgi:hypothetical protein